MSHNTTKCIACGREPRTLTADERAVIDVLRRFPDGLTEPDIKALSAQTKAVVRLILDILLSHNEIEQSGQGISPLGRQA